MPGLVFYARYSPKAIKIQGRCRLQHGGTLKTCFSERSQTQKTISCLIPFIYNVQKRQTQGDRKQISGCQRLRAGLGEWGVTDCLMGRVSLWGDENVLQLGRSDDCTTIVAATILSATELST